LNSTRIKAIVLVVVVVLLITLGFFLGKLDLRSQSQNTGNKGKIIVSASLNYFPSFSYEKHSYERDCVAEIFKDEFESVREIFSESINEVDVPIALVDLNGDGQEELLVGLQHPYFTGSSGTMVLVLLERVNGNLEFKCTFGITGIVVEEDGSQKNLYIIKDSPQPWKTIVIGDVTWEWDGSKYKASWEEDSE
jgi:hypothetical protein